MEDAEEKEEEEEEEEIPSLVNLKPKDKNLEAPARVPLTIVTGIFPQQPFWLLMADTFPWVRLSGRWQDHTCELYSQGAAWQKDRRHSQWLVHTIVMRHTTPD